MHICRYGLALVWHLDPWYKRFGYTVVISWCISFLVVVRRLSPSVLKVCSVDIWALPSFLANLGFHGWAITVTDYSSDPLRDSLPLLHAHGWGFNWFCSTAKSTNKQTREQRWPWSFSLTTSIRSGYSWRVPSPHRRARRFWAKWNTVGPSNTATSSSAGSGSVAATAGSIPLLAGMVDG